MPERPRPLVELTRARILEFVREPEAVFWVFVFPVLLAFALGIAFRTRPAERYRADVVSGTAAASQLVSDLETAGVGARLSTREDAELSLRKGRIDVLVEVAPGGGLVYRFDPTRPEGRAARLAVDDAIQRARGRLDPLATSERPVDETGSRYVDFLIPGLVGLNLMGSGMWGIGFSVVVARTRKLLKRFAVTPMRRSDYLLSFALSRLLFLGLEVAALVGFGWAAFGVAVRGRLIDLTLASLLGAFTFAGLGLLVAARPRTIEAVSGWMNLVMLPMWLLSGTFFSYERFPATVQPAIRVLPLTALNDALRMVINDGAGLVAIGPQLAILALWGALSFALALRLFRWQ